MAYLFGLVVATTGKGTVRAFSSSSRIVRPLCNQPCQPQHQQQPQHQHQQYRTRRYSSEEPRTGWMHNQPDLEKTPSAPAAASPSPVQEQIQEPRTGWLHNSSPMTSSSTASSVNQKSEAQLLLDQAKMQQERNHRILCPPSFHTGGKNEVIVVTEHKISVPVCRESQSANTAKRIDLYFSVVEILKDSDLSWWNSLSLMNPTQRALAYIEKAALIAADGMMLYLQGGPGFGAPSPVVGLSLRESWASEALTHYPRLILMDQRGTGRSSPITKQWLEKAFPELFLLDGKNITHLPSLDSHQESFPNEYNKVMSALEEVTDFMAQFRADNIVRDAEDIKESLLLPSGDADTLARPYGCALGQSYGGFCLMTYLSQIPHPPRICLFTGGIAPMLTPIDAVYDSTWDRVKDRSLKFYDAYPGDIPIVKKIVTALLENPTTLPSGSTLTARRFLQIGLNLGGSPSSFANLHRLFNSAFLNPDDEIENNMTFSRSFLKAMDSEQSFDDHPIYFLLHESIYADGNVGDVSSREASTCEATNWAAHRMYESRVQRPSEWDYRLTSALNSNARPTLLFGEMVFPWMAHGDFVELSGLGMRSLAQSLAKKSNWGPLYNKERMRMALEDASISRAAAAVYYDDMYVDFDASMLVTKRGAPLENCKVWVSNEYQHSGLRDNGAEIFAKLHGMATGKVRIPS